MRKMKNIKKLLTVCAVAACTLGAARGYKYKADVSAQTTQVVSETETVKTNSAAKVYTISPNSKPYKNIYKNATAYNSHTKQYFLIRSYLELMEKKGGGTLVLKKGTYSVTNVLYVPSNVTIKMNDGVVIKKSMKTGSSAMKASGGLFEFIETAKAHKKGVYGKYNGVHNVNIISTGNAVINLGYKGNTSNRCLGLVMAHNKNITIEGITFKNMNVGHFIEMDASKNVSISNCTFTGYKASPTHTSEAINLDTPDKKTKGFNHDWSKYDCTANSNVTITNCTFKKLEKAIGTHQYSKKKYHTGITITDCDFTNCHEGAIEMMNWKKVTLTDCKFNAIGKDTNGKYNSYNKSNTVRALLIRGGVSTLTVTGCTFKNIPRIMQAMPWKNNKTATSYPIIYNSITADEYEAIASNNTVDADSIDCPYIIVNTKYNNFSHPTVYYFE